MNRPRCPRCHARLFSELEMDGETQRDVHWCMSCGYRDHPGEAPPPPLLDRMGQPMGDRGLPRHGGHT